jgi:hypothetical protein
VLLLFIEVARARPISDGASGRRASGRRASDEPIGVTATVRRWRRKGFHERRPNWP